MKKEIALSLCVIWLIGGMVPGRAEAGCADPPRASLHVCDFGPRQILAGSYCRHSHRGRNSRRQQVETSARYP